MSELLDFASRLIEAEGGAVEHQLEGLNALLPPDLSQAWDAGEELRLSETESAGTKLSYGSELLERMIETASTELPVARLSADLSPVRGSQAKAAAERWSLRNGVTRVEEVRVAAQERLWVDAVATLQGDETRQMLVSTAVSCATGTEVPGFEQALGELSSADDDTLPIEDHLLDRALRVCSASAVVRAESFRAGMTRRFERDRERIESYFTDLTRELDRRTARGKLEQGAVDDKKTALQRDRAAKLEALSARFVLRIEVSPVAVRLVHAPGAVATLTLRRRKASRRLTLEYDAATKRIVPPPCEGCGGCAPKPAACDDAFHLLCETCVPRAEGRVTCPACKRARKARQT